MLRPLGGHLRAIEVHEDKITTASSFLYGYIETSVLGCYNVHVNIKCYTNKIYDMEFNSK